MNTLSSTHWIPTLSMAAADDRRESADAIDIPLDLRKTSGMHNIHSARMSARQSALESERVACGEIISTR
jgi:hypothetical protein